MDAPAWNGEPGSMPYDREERDGMIDGEECACGLGMPVCVYCAALARALRAQAPVKKDDAA